jgi:hypothetical protein
MAKGFSTGNGMVMPLNIISLLMQGKTRLIFRLLSRMIFVRSPRGSVAKPGAAIAA